MKKMSKKRYILLDRDGTIIVEREYLSNPDQVELLPNADVGLRKMQAMGFGLIIVTNQSGIGRGFFSEEVLQKTHQKINEEFKNKGVTLDGFLVCPHAPEDNCACRKPKTKLIDDAAKELHFEPSQCVVIGDKLCDIELARNLKATSILVRTGYGKEVERESDIQPDFVTDDLLGAAKIIVNFIIEDKP